MKSLTVLALLAFGAFSLSSAADVCADNIPFHSPLVDLPPCFTKAQQDMILNSNDMPPTVGAITVQIPFNVLVPFMFDNTINWPSWNSFVTYADPSPTLCSSWSTTVTNAPIMNNVPVTADGHPPVIVVNSVNATTAVLGWSYLTDDSKTKQILIFGRHDYYIHDLGNGTISFGSWEKAMGPLVSSNSNAWVAGLGEAMFDTMVGVTCLEMVYKTYGYLDVNVVNASCYYLQYARPTIGPVPVPPHYAQNLEARALVEIPLPPCPSVSPCNDNDCSKTPAALAGVFSGIFGLILGVAVTYFFMKKGGSSSSSGDPYVNMK